MRRLLLWLVVMAGAASPASVSAQLWGDYNNNGSVDAADYVVWRQLRGPTALGSTEWMPNDETEWWVMDDDYTDVWRPRFGNPGGGGGGGSVVPEPSCALLGLLALSCAGLLRRSRE